MPPGRPKSTRKGHTPNDLMHDRCRVQHLMAKGASLYDIQQLVCRSMRTARKNGFTWTRARVTIKEWYARAKQHGTDKVPTRKRRTDSKVAANHKKKVQHKDNQNKNKNYKTRPVGRGAH